MIYGVARTHTVKLHKEIDSIRRKPKFPYPSGPREYQVQAYKSWVDNQCKGIFAMATALAKPLHP